MRLLVFFVAATLSAQKFRGTVTDAMCATADHARMRMGPTDAECAVACVESHDAAWVLYDGKHAYTLIGLKTPEKWAAKKVIVTGAFDAKTKSIRVETVASAK
ncbi:MAG: hypothetical protein ABJC09_13975 [Terriglobia bacterium]